MDTLGDRMKDFESAETERYAMPGLPIMVRLDGKAFHSFCRGFMKPFDMRLCCLMDATTKFLVEELNAVVGYCQSDEITLVLNNDNSESRPIFDGKFHKITSVSASMATAYFNKKLGQAIPERADTMAFFDSRVWNVPNQSEAANCIVWRELDATRNAVQMAAQFYYSHNQLQGKHTGELNELLFAKGINFNDYPARFKRGAYFKRVTRLVKFSSDELEALPPKHAARANPDLAFERSVVENVEFPPLVKIKNKVGVLFNNEDPITNEE
jgi:tRNA(His) 5'-end guanylyltransferase